MRRAASECASQLAQNSMTLGVETNWLHGTPARAFPLPAPLDLQRAPQFMRDGTMSRMSRSLARR